MREQGFFDHTVMCLTPTVIVVDLNMPKVDGFKIVQMLKSDNFLKEIPVIVVSGELSCDAMQKAVDLGADGVFRKPLTAEKLSSFLDLGWQWPTREMLMS